MNWRGRPLTSHQVVVATIASTRTGLRVEAELETGSYPLGLAVTGVQLRALPITAHAEHCAQNDTIQSAGAAENQSAGAAEIGPVRAEERARARAPTVSADERLTGMTSAELAVLPEQVGAGRRRRDDLDLGGPPGLVWEPPSTRTDPGGPSCLTVLRR